jgi:type III secretory pathway component EscR
LAEIHRQIVKVCVEGIMNEVCTQLCSMIQKKKQMQRFWKTGNSQLMNYTKHFFGQQESGDCHETKDVVQDWLKGLLFRHFICTLYFCFNIEFYIVLNFVTSRSGNSTAFILMGIPEVSVFLNGPIIFSDMA